MVGTVAKFSVFLAIVEESKGVKECPVHTSPSVYIVAFNAVQPKSSPISHPVGTYLIPSASKCTLEAANTNYTLQNMHPTRAVNHTHTHKRFHVDRSTTFWLGYFEPCLVPPHCIRDQINNPALPITGHLVQLGKYARSMPPPSLAPLVLVMLFHIRQQRALKLMIVKSKLQKRAAPPTILTCLYILPAALSSQLTRICTLFKPGLQGPGFYLQYDTRYGRVQPRRGHNSAGHLAGFPDSPFWIFAFAHCRRYLPGFPYLVIGLSNDTSKGFQGQCRPSGPGKSYSTNLLTARIAQFSWVGLKVDVGPHGKIG